MVEKMVDIKRIEKEDFIYKDWEEDSLDKINENFTNLNNSKVEVRDWYNLSKNDFTDDYKSKLDWISAWWGWGGWSSQYVKVQDIRGNNYAPNNPIFQDKTIHTAFVECGTVGVESNWYWGTLITYNPWNYKDVNWHPLKQEFHYKEWIAYRVQINETQWSEWMKYIYKEGVVNSVTPAPWDYWGAGLWFIENKATKNFWKLWMRVRDDDSLWFEFKDLAWSVWQTIFKRSWYFVTHSSIFNGWVEFLLNTKDWNSRHNPNNQKWRAFVSLSDWLTINYDNDFQKLTLRSDKLVFEALPTSPVWLPTWGVWREGNTLKIVP